MLQPMHWSLPRASTWWVDIPEFVEAWFLCGYKQVKN